MYKDFQLNVPVFVRAQHRDIIWKGKSYSHNTQIPWQEIGIPVDTIRTWFMIDLVYHNPELEKQNKVGDRLEELSGVKLEKLYNLLNDEVKKRTVSTTEYNSKKVKFSKTDQKQRALIRTWLRGNAWAVDIFHNIRDSILDN